MSRTTVLLQRPGGGRWSVPLRDQQGQLPGGFDLHTGRDLPAVTRKSQLLEFSNALSNSRGCGLSGPVFSAGSASRTDMAEFIRRLEGGDDCDATRLAVGLCVIIPPVESTIDAGQVRQLMRGEVS
jgi:hypothetical protein